MTPGHQRVRMLTEPIDMKSATLATMDVRLRISRRDLGDLVDHPLQRVDRWVNGNVDLAIRSHDRRDLKRDARLK